MVVIHCPGPHNLTIFLALRIVNQYFVITMDPSVEINPRIDNCPSAIPNELRGQDVAIDKVCMGRSLMTCPRLVFLKA